MLDGTIDGFSVALLYGNAILWPVFLVVFGLLEPWRRSWFGWAIVLLSIGIAQMTIRAVITSHFGDAYPGRDLVLMVGRLELLASGVALLVGLVQMRRHAPRPRH